MSVQLHREVLTYSRSEGPARSLMQALAFHVDHRGDDRTVQVPAEVLASEAGLSVEGYYRAVRALEKLGEVERAGKGGRGKAALIRVADLVELYGEPVRPRARRQAPSSGQRPLVASVNPVASDSVSSTETLSETLSETVSPATGFPSREDGVEEGEGRGKAPLTPASGGTDDRLSLRAERARQGSRRKRDVVALKAVGPRVDRPADAAPVEAWQWALDQLRSRMAESAWDSYGPTFHLHGFDGDVPVITGGLDQHQRFLRDALTDWLRRAA